MKISLIVAAADNDIIGNNNALIWHLSADLKHFKSITTGHPVIMGRKTFESIGKALPKRRNIVITRNSTYEATGCEMADSIETALQMAANEEEVFIIGGGSIYNEMWDKADYLYLTRIHITPEGDTRIPPVDETFWKEIKREEHSADEKNAYDYTFIDYERI